jgi:hypothetical protein
MRRQFGMCDQLKEKFDEWREWLLGEDVHSIRNQIRTMIWDSAVFQIINEARNYAPRDDKGQIRLNAHVHNFINRCFFDTQAMAIRRLVDRDTCQGPKSVTSLYRLLEDIEKHADLLTRENMLGALALPYDYMRTKDELRRARDRTSKSWGKDREDCDLSEYAHKCMDFLAGVDACARKPHDTARPDIFEWLKRRLADCDAVRNFVNKFLAHSATPESRAAIPEEHIDVSLGQILNAHKTICQIAECVSQNLFLSSMGGPLPRVPDVFKYFEEPWATKEAVEKLREWRDNYEDSTNQWLVRDWQSECAAHEVNNGG